MVNFIGIAVQVNKLKQTSILSAFFIQAAEQNNVILQY